MLAGKDARIQEVHALHFCRQLRQHFDQSKNHSKIEVKTYLMAGYVIQLKCLNQNMLSILTKALAHAETQMENVPDLTIHMWDSSMNPADSIEYPWPTDAMGYLARGEVKGYNTDQVYTLVDIHTRALMVLNKQNNEAYYWINDASLLPWWASGSPLQYILSWWMQDKGLQLTHAGAVGFEGGGVLLAGSGGAGKSTTVFNCMNAGMQFVSEDYCLIGLSNGLRAYSVYSSAKLEQKTVDLFPEIIPHIDNVNRTKEEKAFIFHHRIWPEKIISDFPVKAIVILNVSGQKNSMLEGATSDAALKALSMSTMWQLVRSDHKTFTLLKSASEAVKCYRLNLGTELKQIPEILQGLL